jgi:hypothetical protein
VCVRFLDPSVLVLVSHNTDTPIPLNSRFIPYNKPYVCVCVYVVFFFWKFNNIYFLKQKLYGIPKISRNTVFQTQSLRIAHSKHSSSKVGFVSQFWTITPVVTEHVRTTGPPIGVSGRHTMGLTSTVPQVGSHQRFRTSSNTSKDQRHFQSVSTQRSQTSPYPHENLPSRLRNHLVSQNQSGYVCGHGYQVT